MHQEGHRPHPRIVILVADLNEPIILDDIGNIHGVLREPDTISLQAAGYGPRNLF